MIEAFNRMLERETEREGALRDAKTELEYSEAELRRFNEHLEQLVEERTRDLALSDPLTGLANRRHFHDRLEYALAVAKRLDRRVALLFIDLDKLKAVNDDFGHLVGDGLLKQVAGRLTEASRDTDIVVRLGGDEFAVIMTNLEETGTARLLAKRIIHTLSLPFDIDGHQVGTGASIGISVFPDDDIDIDELIRKADVALYQVKSEGRGAYHLYDHEMHAAARRQGQLEQELRLAIERDELVFHYQPQLALAEGAVIGAEALVRWQHPERGLLASGEFIAAAESSGLVVQIGELALRRACAQVAAWRRQGLPEMRVAVNISPRHFRSGDLVASVKEALRVSAISPHLLELEITESMMVEDIDQACDRLERLHGLGVELSIDDFGTGYSCLAYLQNFPVQRLKIDQSFIAGLTDDDDSAAIVEAIIRLGHGLRLKVIAEGIETEAQLAKLRELSCDEVQGYLFAKPTDAEAFTEWVAAREGSRERQPANALA